MVHQVEEDLEDAYSSPVVLAHELLHRAAFSGGLSNPLLPDPAGLAGLDGEALRAYMASVFTPSNMALTAAGADLKQLEQVCVVCVCGVCGVWVGGGGATRARAVAPVATRPQSMLTDTCVCVAHAPRSARGRWPRR
jgi:hypothetical protein